MKIYKKLILSLVGLTSIILVATLLLARWSFEQGFNDFLQAQEMERLSRISEEILKAAPLMTDVSDFDKNLLERILERHSVASHGPRGPRPRIAESGPRPLPPHLRDKPVDNRRDGPDKLIFTAIYDQSGAFIAGDIVDADITNTLITFEYTLVKNEHLVGSLKSWKSERFESAIASEFSKQQITTSVLIGLFCFALAAVLSYFGAKTLLAPIKLIISGVEDLSNGNYTKTLTNNRVDEFGELINNVNRLAMVLEQTRKAKNRWFADISHELRTPLTVLMGELEALRLGIRPLGMEQIDSLTQEAQLLKRLIDDLYQLSVSDIGALRYEFEVLDISTLLSRVVEQISSRAKSHSISLEQQIEKGVTVNGDEDRLNQLLANLVNNALAYTDDNGSIKVTLSSTNQQINISVQDSAPSLSQHECEHIFEPLYRHDKARTRNAGGAGLGLAICKNIVEAHGGGITAKPSALGGIEVKITLPIVPIQLKKRDK